MLGEVTSVEGAGMAAFTPAEGSWAAEDGGSASSDAAASPVGARAAVSVSALGNAVSVPDWGTGGWAGSVVMESSASLDGGCGAVTASCKMGLASSEGAEVTDEPVTSGAEGDGAVAATSGKGAL